AGQLVVSPKSTLKNVNAARRTLLLGRGKQQGVKLKVSQRDGPRPAPRAVGEGGIEGGPVAWDTTAELRKAPRLENVDRKRPVEVLGGDGGRMKGMEGVRLRYNSHRTANLPLVARQIGKKEEGAGPDAGPSAPDPTGASPLPGGPAPGPGGEGRGMVPGGFGG